MNKKILAGLASFLMAMSIQNTAIETKGCSNQAVEVLEAMEVQEVLSDAISKTDSESSSTNMVLKVDSSLTYINNNNVRSSLTSRSSAIVRGDGRAMVPIRMLAESLNATVKYDVTSNKIKIQDDTTILTIYVNTHKVMKNGVWQDITLDMEYVDNSIYVSAREIVNLLDVSIDYSRKGTGDYVVITKDDSASSNVIKTIDVDATYNGFIKPVTGTNKSYVQDSGLDIHCPMGSPVYAVADCYIVYSEYGHTPWTNPGDTAYSIYTTLDTPVEYNGKTLKHVFYTHLSEVVYSGNPGRMIHQGELIGYSGIANNTPHLHFQVSEMDNMPELMEFYGATFGDPWVAGK